MKRLRFVDDPRTLQVENAFVAHIPVVTSKGELMSELASALRFPGYFGSNWDALADCLTDFQWLASNHIVIVHDEVPQLPEEDLANYIDVITIAIDEWAHDVELVMEVVFPEEARALVNLYLPE